MSPLDSEEIEILEAFEKGELKRASTAARDIEQHKAIAEATFRQDASLNVSLSSKDLRSLQILALQEGIPCQAFVSSILHKFVAGQLVEKGFDKALARPE